jgi:hypothetical protein
MKGIGVREQGQGTTGPATCEQGLEQSGGHGVTVHGGGATTDVIGRGSPLARRQLDPRDTAQVTLRVAGRAISG